MQCQGHHRIRETDQGNRGPICGAVLWKHCRLYEGSGGDLGEEAPG